MRAAILLRLWARIAQPTQVSAPARPRDLLRSNPNFRFRRLILPSHPARHLARRLNHACRSNTLRAALLLPLYGMHTLLDASPLKLPFLAPVGETPVGGKFLGQPPGLPLMPLDRSRRQLLIRWIPLSDLVPRDDAVFCFLQCHLVTEVGGLPEPALPERPRIWIEDADQAVCDVAVACN